MHSIKDTVKQLIGKSLDAYNKKYTNPINNRIDTIVAQSGTDNTEIVDARIDSAGITHTTLNNRILAETKMTDEKLIEYSGSSLSIEDTMPGYLQNIEILGNTIQDASNLADIRSVGDKVEGQELYEIPVVSCGKNLCISRVYQDVPDVVYAKVRIRKNCTYTISTSLGIGGGYIALNTVPTHNNCKQLISDFGQNKYTFTSNLSDGEYYLIFWKSRLSSSLNDTVQLEEGTVATPYEPYVEDKLTILSPVQLEKGDILKEVDGVWGIEKSVITINPNDNLEWIMEKGTASDMCLRFRIKNNPYITGMDTWVISSHFGTVLNNNGYNIEGVGVSSYVNYGLLVWINKDKLNSFDSQGFNQWRIDNNFIVKFAVTNPQFIPLPHDQQIKLRTFANKTNISFGCEIEGTIKAQVPKSLGATVNTHTEQIRSLNNELNRVKKLEESTVSTVETESDFTAVEATSNGYFEDVKLEGKTLVNLWDISKIKKASSISVADDYVTVNADGSWIDCHPVYKAGTVPMLKPNTEYTVIAHIKNNTLNNYMRLNVDNKNRSPFTKNVMLEQGFTGYYICKLNTKTDLSKSDTSLRCQVGSECTTGTIIFNCILLEGDHTQNPPSYFEGLASVGQSATPLEDGADEIVVESVKDVIQFEQGTLANSNGQPADNVNRIRAIDYIDGKDFELVGVDFDKFDTLIMGYDENKTYVYTSGWGKFTKPPLEYPFVKVVLKINDTTPITPNVLEKPIYVANRNVDKKRLLYYNEETQAWEKPILRQWDSIEKHSDGKYYYHQRSGEVVLNGSEDWGDASSSFNSSTTNSYHIKVTDYIQKPKSVICDKFISDIARSEDVQGIYHADTYVGVNRLVFRVYKDTYSNLDTFKQWLQANNVTVVYQLAQEKVYECTNIDLITYANETNYVVESGVLSPKTTLKVHSNISNVVSLLQKKVSVLESNMTKYMITQNRMQLASTYSADSVTFKVDYTLCSEEVEYNEDLYNLILNNIMVGKDNYDYNKMFNIILDYASWNQISWEQFDILVGVMDSQHNPPIEEEIPNEIM